MVIEHMIQCSDVAHTMQNWRVYIKWNKRLFEELYNAYILGRFPKDPSLNWYEGELGFFDNYVIPIAQKLCDSGVFGTSSDEYLKYAKLNRQQWELEGKKVVESMVEKMAAKNQDVPGGEVDVPDDEVDGSSLV